MSSEGEKVSFSRDSVSQATPSTFDMMKHAPFSK